MKKSVLLSFVVFGIVMASEMDIQKQKMAAGELKKTLMSELKSKMADGPAVAIEFCSKNALNITYSVAKKYGLNIKRVSEKTRNAYNYADDNDKKALAQFAEQITKDKKPAEYVVVGGKYYEPMIIGEMCVVCHGGEDSMQKETKEKIKQLYPNDKATGYKIGDLRGAISVW